MKSLSVSPERCQVAAWVGLDWADQQHVICLYEVATGHSTITRLEQKPEALQDWLSQMRQRFSGAPVAIVLEQARGAVIYALLGADFVRLYPVNPQSLASYRKAYAVSGAKSDPVDAVLLMEMVRKSPERFRVWKPDDAETRSLQLLTENRRQLVDQKTALTNQLTSLLKTYYPQALELAGALDSLQACDFLTQWPTLEVLQQARPGQIRQLYREHGRPRSEQLDQRLEQIRQARPLTRDPAALLSGSMMVEVLVQQLRPLLAAIERFDRQITVIFGKHPDRSLFDTLPGAGAVLAPRLVAAFGTDRDRFQSAQEAQQLFGIAPVTEQSGKQHWVHWRWACSKFLRQTFHEFAGHSRHWCGWSRALYQRLRRAGKGHHAALRVLAFKWIRILFHCWKTRTDYDESIYLKSLQKRNPTLWAEIQRLPPPRKKKAA
ncbi:MAG TPA: IS110 family transposase [Anaerolineales bacterium]|jgi:transposase|nr:IS110 family transposase [Anaerolineales bacterium]